MDKRQSAQAKPEKTGISLELFTVVLVFTAIFACIFVLSTVLNVKRKTPNGSEVPPPVSENVGNNGAPGGDPAPEQPAVPIWNPSTEYKTVQATANTKAIASEISSKYGILVDAETGEILSAKDTDIKFNPASMTKVMTLLVACERLTTKDLEASLTFTEEISKYVRPASGPYKGSDCHWADLGDGATLLTQLYGIGVESAADCTLMVVCYLMGASPAESEAQFVALMNQKASEMGLVNTHFDNVIGHESDNNYTTAKDMAAILLRALECPLIKEILSTESITCDAFGFRKDGSFNPQYPTRFYSTLFNANPDSPSREKAYETEHGTGSFKLANGSFLGGKTGTLTYSGAWNYSLASFAEVSGKLYLVITGETLKGAGPLEDAKYLYDSIGN